jgi:hypothetical protein
MTGPRPAGRHWTLTDDDMLRKLVTSNAERRTLKQYGTQPNVSAIRSRFQFQVYSQRRRQRAPSAVQPTHFRNPPSKAQRSVRARGLCFRLYAASSSDVEVLSDEGACCLRATSFV